MDASEEQPRDIVVRTFEFAVRIVKVCRYLDKKLGVPKNLIWQLAGAGTAVGANVEEGQAAQSKPDFIHKYSIAQKEARESSCFLRVLIAAGFLSKSQAGRWLPRRRRLRPCGRAASSPRSATWNLASKPGRLNSFCPLPFAFCLHSTGQAE